MKLSTIAFATLIAGGIAWNAHAGPTLADINKAAIGTEAKANTIKLQTLLARANASPGVIDGLMGQSTTDAIEAFERMNGFDVDGELDEKVKKALPSGDVVKTYTITEEDAAYDLTGDIPDRYDEMAKLDKMGFQSHAEMIAERFEMDIDLLKELNPEADFAKAGTKVIVTDVRAQDARKVTKIEI
ncbi:MAG: peptidoglycan-binding domain-containing protein, partial [Pseudomonadota bacterium]